MMKERKKCEACGKPLMAFNGRYLHPEVPCNGIKDAIFIEAYVEDEGLNKLFVEKYGVPEMDDYELLAEYEAEKDKMKTQYDCALSEYDSRLDNLIELVNKKLNHPVIRFMVKLLRLDKEEGTR